MYKYKIFYEIYDHQLHLREKNPRWLVLTKLKAIQNPGFDFTWVYADAKTGFYSGLSFENLISGFRRNDDDDTLE